MLKENEEKEKMMKKLSRKAVALFLLLCMVISGIAAQVVFGAVGDVPAHSKTLTDNHDGTYQLALNIRGESEKIVNKVNVIVIFDRSGSMSNNTGGPGSQTRMVAARSAVNNLARTLLSLNGQGDNPADAVEMALVSFSTTATTHGNGNPTTSYSTFSGWVNGMNASGGTNWEDALHDANEVNFNDNDQTFVIFVSDGNPTFRNTRGTTDYLPRTDNPNWSNRDWNYYRSDDIYYDDNRVYGLGSDNPNQDNYSPTSMQRCYDNAVDDAQTLANKVGANNFYTIGAYGDVSRMQNLTTAAGAPSGNYFNASSTTELQQALASILEDIQTAGIGSASISDPTTTDVVVSSDVTAHLLTVDDTSFKYYKNGVEWADAPTASLDESGNVVWDLSSEGVLDNNVTYTVTFDVWPTQDTYDLIADLENGDKDYDTEVPAAVKEYLIKNADGSYTLRTNKDFPTVTYTDTREEDPQPHTIEYTNPKPVPTEVSEMDVAKVWFNDLDDRGKQEYPNGFTMDLTRDDEVCDRVTVKPEDWADKVYIATGLMRVHKNEDGNITGIEVLEDGHDYTLVEPEDMQYRWELVVETIHPMLINGVLTSLVEVLPKDIPEGMGSADFYTLADVNFYRINGKVYKENGQGQHASVSAYNERKSNLNLTKVVDGDDAPEDEEFTYTISATDPNGADLWFSVVTDPENPDDTLVKDLDTTATAEVREGQNTGYYYFSSGSSVTVKMKAGWNLRFTNLPTGTTYNVAETTTGMTTGFAFDSVNGDTPITVSELPDGAVDMGDGTYSYNGIIYTGSEEEGYTYTYQPEVDEATVNGEVVAPNGQYQITYTNVYSLKDVEITKVWEDNDDQDGIRPTIDEFKSHLKLLADGTDVTAANADKLEVTDNKDGTFTAKWTAIQRFKENTTTKEEISYTVEETEIPGYTTTGSPANEDGTITNTHTPEVISADATKAWLNADGTTTAPAGATVVYTLYADGKATDYTVTLDGTADTAPTGTAAAGYESEAWKASFVNLPKKDKGTAIVYTIKETTGYPGYITDPTDPVVESGGAITNKQNVTSADATKTWKNADGTTTAPEGATVVYTLYADGTATNYKVTLDGTADPVPPTSAGGYESEAWKASFVNLAKYKADGTTEVVYTIAETTTYPGYTPSTTSPVASGGNIANTQEATAANATKAWVNADGSTTAPNGATVQYTLYADGTATNYKVTLDGTADSKPTGTAGYESASWKAEFINLPKYQAGTTTEIEYTIAETTTYPGYTASTSDPVASGGEITNTQEATTANAKKAWVNADGTNTAPEGGKVTYTLYADGTATNYKVTLDGTVDDEPTGTAGYESAAWTAMFVNLPKYKADGTTEIVYTIAETTTYPGYTPSTEDPVNSDETITNTQEGTETNATKAWVNADGSTEPPEGASVVYTLYADGTATNYKVTLDGTVDDEPTGTAGYESAAWTAMFVNLPKYKADGTTEIVYTIAETTTYPGYTPSTTESVASGSAITNSQDATEASATKAWKNADGTTTAPEGGKVTYTLYADGKATDYTVELDGTVDDEPTGTAGYESESWKALFVNLPKYQAGTTTEIVYTIAETTPYPGYTPSTEDPVTNGGKVTNTQEATTANAKKAWINVDGSTTAPEDGKVTYTLYADGEATEYTVELDGTADTAPTVTGGYESEAWTAMFVNLPKYQADGETEIVYTIAETGTYPNYTPSTEEPVASGETITNKYEAEGEGEIKVTKAVEGAEWPEDKTLTLSLAGAGSAPLPETASAELTEEGTATFGPIPFDESHVGKKFTYTISESSFGAGWTGSGDVTATITVTDNGNGTLTATTTYSPEDATITNTYEASGKATLEVEKKLEGAEWPEGKKLTFTLSGEGGTMPEEKTVELTAAGKATFGEITYDESDAGKTYTYTITEDGFGAGWTGSPEKITATVKVVDNGDGTLDPQVTYDPKDATVTNTYKATGEIELEAKKALEGAGWPEGKKLTFTLSGEGGTLPETKTVELTEEGTAKFGKITYDESDAGKTYTYTISEDGFGDGWTGSPEKITATVKVVDNGDGTLDPQVTYSPEDATITNTYEAAGDVELEVTKALKGHAWPSGKTLTFTLAGEGGTLPEDKTATLTAAGTAKFGKITYTEADIDQTYTYTISEDGFGDGWTGSGDITATVKVTDNGDGTLATEVTYDPENATITNTYDAEGEATLEVTKALEGSDWPEGQKLTLTLTAEDGTPMPETVEAELTEEGTVTFGPIKYELKDRDKTYTYTISEGEGFTTGGWNGSGDVTATVNVTDNNDGTLAAEVTYSPEDKTIKNTYTVEPTEIVLSASKTLEVESGNNPPDVSGEYTLTLKDESGETVDTQVNPDGNGTKVDFKTLVFEAAGEYKYTVTEEGSVDGVTNGTASYDVTVKVTDNKDGTLSAEVTEGNQVTKFTNTYSVKPTKAVIETNKSLKGRKLKEGEFEFNLKGAGGVDETKANDADGHVEFSEIEYDTPGTYEYTIKEVKGSLPKVDYATNEVKVTVTVTDNSKGQLEAEVKYDGENIFKNTYTPDPGEANISVKKELTGRDLNAGEFEFELKLKSFEPTEEQQLQLDSTVPEEPEEELQTEEPEEELQTEEPEEELQTEEPEEELQTEEPEEEAEPETPAEEEAVVLDNVEDDAAGTTAFKTVAAKVKSTASADKTLKLDAAMPEDQTTTNDAAGFVNFETIKFDEVGTYTFEVTEKKGGLGGVTYDGSKIEVKVEVTYDEETGEFSTSVTYPDDIIFDNTYEPAPTTAAPEVSKVLNGRDLKDGEFNFTLTDEEGQEIETVKNNAAGKVTFSPITYSETGTYTYTIKEAAGSNDRMDYDAHEVIVTVKVTDNLKGNLVAEVTYEGGETFINTYYPKNRVWIDPPVKKVVIGTPEKTETYKFMLEANDPSYPMPKAANGKSKMTMTIKGAGEKEFGKIYFTEPGTYSYNVFEIDGDNPDCEYDYNVYTVTAEVTEDSNRKLHVKSTYEKNGKITNVAKFKFVNRYEEEEEPPVTPTKTGDKNKLAGWLALMLLAGTGVVVVYRKRKQD